MEQIATADKLAGVGRYRQALESLGESKRDPRLDVLRAELLEATGRSSEAEVMAEALLEARGISDVDRSRAEFVLSRVKAEVGDFDGELNHLQRSILHAQKSHDLKCTCWSQLRLLALAWISTDRYLPNPDSGNRGEESDRTLQFWAMWVGAGPSSFAEDVLHINKLVL
jgi:hypothetical protein